MTWLRSLLPYQEITLYTKRSPEQLKRELRETTKRTRFRVFPNCSNVLQYDREAYRGEVDESGFRLLLDISSLNIQQPVIHGQFEVEGTLTKIKITQQMTLLSQLLTALRKVVGYSVILYFCVLTLFFVEAKLWQRVIYIAFFLALLRLDLWIEKAFYRVLVQRVNKDFMQRFEAVQPADRI